MSKLFNKAINDFKNYKDYVIYTVKSELKVQVSGTFLGYFWWILDPLMYMLVYMLVVMIIFDRGGPDFPIYVFSALVPWKWTVSSINDSTSSIKGKANILHQVYIPKFLLPLIKCLINTSKFFFGVLVLMVMIPFFNIDYSLINLTFFVVFAVHFLFILGLSLNLAHIGVYFKDINNILSFSIRLWFYLSPALYQIADIPERVRFLWWFNPMTTFYASYRNLFMYGEHPEYLFLGIWTLVSLGLIYVGLRHLYKHDKIYTKVI